MPQMVIRFQLLNIHWQCYYQWLEILQAHQSLTNKEWNPNAFKGTELYHKTLGVIGAGRIGLGVATLSF